MFKKQKKSENVGLLVGYSFGGIIYNCYISGTVIGKSHVGGIAGWNEAGTISNTFSKCNVTGRKMVGGIVGWNARGLNDEYAIIDSSYVYSKKLQARDSVGGIAGNNDGHIYNSGSFIDCQGIYKVGGIAGWSSGTISNCYSAGNIEGDTIVGGLLGWNYYAELINTYTTGEIYGTNESIGGLAGDNFRNSTIKFCYTKTKLYVNTNSKFVGGMIGDNEFGAVSESEWISFNKKVLKSVGKGSDKGIKEIFKKQGSEFKQSSSLVIDGKNILIEDSSQILERIRKKARYIKNFLVHLKK